MEQVAKINPQVSTLQTHSVSDLERMALAIAKSGLFGIKTTEQALALMLISQAEGRHPALAARDYDIIQGRPAKKSEAVYRDFLDAGGKVEWIQRDEKAAEAIFSHPSCPKPVTVRWDAETVKKAELDKKDMHRKYPRQMLSARCISEGVRATYPAATSGMYVPEEVRDFEQPRNVTPLPIQSTLPIQEERDATSTQEESEPIDLVGLKKKAVETFRKLSSITLKDPDELFANCIGSKTAKISHLDKLTANDTEKIIKVEDAIMEAACMIAEREAITEEGGEQDGK